MSKGCLLRFAACLFIAFAFSGALAEECPDLRTYKLGTPIQEIISANPKLKLKAVSKGNDLYRKEHLDRRSGATIYTRRITWDDPTELHLITDSHDGVLVEIFTTVRSDPDDVYNGLVSKFGAPQTVSNGPNFGAYDHSIDAFWTLQCGANVIFHGVGRSDDTPPVSRISYTAKGFRKDILD